LLVSCWRTDHLRGDKAETLDALWNDKHIIVMNVLTRIAYEERCKQGINIKTISSPVLDLTESNSVQLRECVIIFIKLLRSYDHTDKLSNTFRRSLQPKFH
jgi:hypothetical protein